MAVAHDVASESHTGAIGSTSEASFSWSHGGAASSVKGILVFVFSALSGDESTGVTYGGESLARVSGGLALDTAGEPGAAAAWFLGTGVPQGTQTVVVSRNNNAIEMYAVAITVTAGADAEVTGVVLLEEDGEFTEQSVDDGSPGTNSMRYAGTWDGHASPSGPGANSTALLAIDFGGNGCATVRETTAGQGARSVGFSAAADDRAIVHLAIREAAAAAGLDEEGTFPMWWAALQSAKIQGEHELAP